MQNSIVQFSREYLEKRLEQGYKELSSGRTLLRVAGLVIVINSLLVVYNLWRGWRTTDYYYAFILAVWMGFFIVQRKILERKQAELDRLSEALQEL